MSAIRQKAVRAPSVLLGWFVTCRDCKCSFFRILPKKFRLKDGKVVASEPNDDKISIPKLRCPDCGGSQLYTMEVL
jgi:hypothetical protein